MKKVFLVLLALSLSFMFISCSEDDTVAPTPTPEPDALEISTGATLTTGYTCSPYRMEMEATGGTTPYTWALATGSTLPTGMELSTDGIITGMMESIGNHNFSIVCTDAASETDEVAFSLGIEVPANPSIAVFFDEAASLCSGEITYPAVLECYAYIMLDGDVATHARGASFKLNLLDAEGTPLTSGEDYIYTSITYPSYVPAHIGYIATGLSVGFNRALPYTAPIGICSFSLMLFEDFSEISFEIVKNPLENYTNMEDPNSTEPIFIDGNMEQEFAIGRRAAINY